MRKEVKNSSKMPRSILGYGINEIKGNPKTIFVLDTNVLVNDSKAIDKLLDKGTNAVVIPWVVLGELDALKVNQDLSRQISEVVKSINRMLHDKDENFYIAQGDIKYFTDLDRENPDHHVIALCLSIQRSYPKAPITLVSNDAMVHVIGLRLGIKVEEYKADQVQKIDFEKPLPRFLDSDFHINEDGNFILESNEHDSLIPLNGGAVISSRNEASCFVVIRKNNLLIPMQPEVSVLGITPFSLNGEKNWSQHVVLHQLFDRRIKLMTIHGEAGTGKTLLAIAAAIAQLKLEDSNDDTPKAGNGNLRECLIGSGYDNIRRKYRKVLIARPLIHLSNRDSMGFLPGDIASKVDPWLAPIYDNLEFIGSLSEANSCLIKRLRSGESKDEPEIEILPLSFIRGRTLARAIIIIDEAQNLTRAEIKTIVTRAGEGSKVVLVGDINQIDIRWLDKLSSGLTHVSVKMNGLPYFANSYLDLSVRSEMARDAALRL